MDDELWKREEVESPCIKLCVIHPDSGLCAGCHRSPEEIAQWSALPPERRREIATELPGRERLHARRRGGRAARQHRARRNT